MYSSLVLDLLSKHSLPRLQSFHGNVLHRLYLVVSVLVRCLLVPAHKNDTNTHGEMMKHEILILINGKLIYMIA